MVDIHLDGVGHSYDGGRTWALRPMTRTLHAARAYALLGPSGCGKTTLLNIISGLLTPTVGRIWFGDREVTRVPTAARNIAQVFQFPVLYEGMSVYDNLAFPLRNRGWPKAEIDRRVRAVSHLLGLDSHLHRRSRRLDPGRQQIVSLGRGLVRSDVAAVLLDEPLTVVDPALRWTLRSTLKEIHRDTGHTLVYVTHDQTEALTFADEVMVLQDGDVVQSGEPTELFLSPAHEFVGHFIGSPGMNMIPADLVDGVVRVGDTPVGRAADTDGALPSGPVRIGVRPEFVRISAVPTAPGLPARVTAVDRMGAYHLVHAEIDGRRLSAKVDTGSRYAPGALEYFHFVPDRAFLFRDAIRCGTIAAQDGAERA
ncbi:ABC transporter ATP-binding protein [Actinoplanes sp. NPDC049118]|uniref:ABC transporter ATP-binding protein n=1 Tax=Actinoplanes sp. NPDC049118 TaxID=3155769 RepID=UPI00340A6038